MKQNLIEQLAKYQNAPIPTLEAAKKGAFPTISPWVAGAILEDRIDDQKRMAMQQGAAQGQQPTVDEQQDMEVEGIMQALAQQSANQEQAAMQAEPVSAAEGGLMQAKLDPRMFDFCGGGIIAFDEGGKAESKSAEEKQRESDQDTLKKVWEFIKDANLRAGTAIADVAALPVRGLAGAYDTAVVRPMRAAGIDAGYLSKHLVPEGVDPNSMTPFYDKYIRSNEPKEAAPQAAPAARAPSSMSAGENDKQTEYARLVKQGMPPEMAAKVAGLQGAAPAGPAGPAGGAKPAAAGAGGAGAPAASKGVMSLLTNSPEWKAMEAARTKPFEAPDMPTTAGGLAAERAAHLKAQGITEMPWEQAAKQTAELRRMMKADDAAREAKLEADKGRPTFHRLIANMGPGSFAQSSAQSLRKQVEYEDAIAAETQRLKEKRYDQNLKLNEIDAKAQELRYNEAVGDVAAAQKNRADLATLKRQYQKDSAALAKDQATLRERAGAADLSAETQLKAAGMRAGASSALTPFQLAKIRDMAEDNVNNAIKAGGIPMQMALQKDPGMRDRMIKETEDRILAQMGGGAAPAPVQSQYGLPPKGAVREVKR